MTYQWEGKLFRDGEFVEGSGQETQAVTEKATGAVLATAGVATAGDVDAAVTGAVEAQKSWAAVPFTQRAGMMRALATVLTERREEVAGWVMRETGAVRGKADYEIDYTIKNLHESAALPAAVRGEVIPSEFPGKNNYLVRVPLGAIAVITPWNLPLLLAMYAVAPAIALGNTVVLKPAPDTPVTGGLLIAELFKAAGFPAGVLQVVTGSGPELGARLVEHPLIAKVQFTGSTAVGRLIAESAGRRLKRVGLELGGNNALVVMDDADVDLAANLGAWSSFQFQGQTCISASRHIVMRPLVERYIEALCAKADALVVGDPVISDVHLGPMISARQRDRVLTLLENSCGKGAKVVAGGTHDGLYLRPTVVRDVTADMDLFTEEVFGPVAPVIAVDSEEEALELTNATNLGLVNSVCTSDPWRGLRFAQRVNSGMVHVNDATCIDDLQCSFGGWGASGIGRLGGNSGIESFTDVKWISVQNAPTSPYPYPY